MRGEDKAGLYITVIFHLAVIIVLLIAQIGASLSKENSFVLDFSRQEQIESERKQIDFKDDISRRIDDLIAASESGSLPVRNVSVDRGKLKDDRGTDAEELYKEAERLQNDLNRGVDINEDDFADVAEDRKQPDRKKEESHYSGPSVVSYELDGRKASRLSIPAYRCFGGGMVTVLIGVDPSGKVLSAKVEEDASSMDKCLRDFAVNAAMQSRFSASKDAPPKQYGNIVYQFIAQ